MHLDHGQPLNYWISRVKILIIDDSDTSRLLLESILRHAGHADIALAGSAQEAFRILELDNTGAGECPVDAILMDLMMPDMDGIEATRRIKAVGRLRDIPIVMVTVNADQQSLEQAFQAGAIDYITKPVNRIELRVRVHSVLKLKEEIDQHRIRERELMDLAGRLAEANKRLKEMAIRDELTGLHNRRHFMEHARAEFQRHRRYGSSLSLLMIDADHFKNINDTFGHSVGDLVLAALAETGRTQLREVDIFARIGGEEFAILLPETSLDDAAVVAERIRASVESSRLRVDQHRLEDASENDLQFTVSIGVACTDSQMQDVDTLLKLADRALYAAKNAGRNRIERSQA